jgi:hypothetical protein
MAVPRKGIVARSSVRRVPRGGAVSGDFLRLVAAVLMPPPFAREEKPPSTECEARTGFRTAVVLPDKGRTFYQRALEPTSIGS